MKAACHSLRQNIACDDHHCDYKLSVQSHKKAGMMWREAGLRWKDFLPEDEDVNKFVTEKVISDLSVLSAVG